MRRIGNGRVTNDRHRTPVRRYAVALVLLLGALLGPTGPAAAIARVLNDCPKEPLPTLALWATPPTS